MHPAPPYIYPLSLHDALPICGGLVGRRLVTDDWTIYCSRSYAEAHGLPRRRRELKGHAFVGGGGPRSEEHTSELQSRRDLVCRLLLEKKNNRSSRAVARCAAP